MVSGVEIEALTVICVAALTIYDPWEVADRTIHIEYVCPLRISGGHSGDVVVGDTIEIPEAGAYETKKGADG